MNKYFLDYLIDHQAALRRSVSNDYAPILPPPPPIFNIKPVSYGWDKPSHSNSLSRSQTIKSIDQSRHRDYKVIPRSGMVRFTNSLFKILILPKYFCINNNFNFRLKVNQHQHTEMTGHSTQNLGKKYF